MTSEEFVKIFREGNEFDRHNQMKFSILSPGHIQYEMPVLKEHIAFKDVGHGGVIAGFMDATLGFAALSQAIMEGELVSTVEFKLNFIKPITLGQILIGEGKVEHNGKSLIISHGNIFVKDTNILIAKGLGTFNKYPMSKKGLTDVFSTK